MDEITELKNLRADPKNARRHNARNIGQIVSSLQRIGAARSGVIDETGTILAGNGTAEALRQAGIERVRVVETDGAEWVVVKRTGLTEEQKRILSVSDNRAAELATWDGPGLEEQGIDLKPWFTEKEMDRLKSPSDFDLQDVTLREDTTGPVGAEVKITLIIPPEDYEVARKAVLRIVEGNPTWDIRLPK